MSVALPSPGIGIEDIMGLAQRRLDRRHVINLLRMLMADRENF